MSKVGAVLATLNAQQRSRFARGGSKEALQILLGPGAFAPFHKMHYAMFVMGKEELEKRAQVVVGGFISPSSDRYVHGKLGADFIPLNHRCAICDIYAAETNWITTIPWGWPNGYQTGQVVEQLLSAEFPEFNFHVRLMYGADFIAKYDAWEDDIDYVVPGRPGYTEAVAENIKRRPCCGIILLPELEDISSTLIRQAMHDNDVASLSRFLHPQAVTYLLEHFASWATS
ncbi:hypothetical protein Pelo_15861 [Pelomyxa schiedti]|nr:hypothetical protein Pelo_15861 [Pelomyxa schiedti]